MLASLLIVANLFYFLSLRGASTPAKMNHRLKRLGSFVACSALASSLQLWLAYWPSWCSLRTRRVSCVSQAVTLVAWFACDHGNRLLHHGAYNLLVFTLIFLPVTFVLFGLTGWAYLAGSFQHKPWRFPVQLFTVILISLITILITIRQKENALTRGFFGWTVFDLTHSDTSTSECHWQAGTPWFDLIPFRQNFFVGPMTCPRIESFQASLVNGSLLIECNAATTQVQTWFGDNKVVSGPAYSLLPRTEDWGLPKKNDSLESTANGLQENVLRYIEQHTFSYVGSVALPDDTDTALAWCGESEPKIVHRIVPVTVSPSTEPARLTSGDGLNLIVIFIDAMSHAHFHRRLPQTARAIESLAKPDEKAPTTSRLYEFFRYHTVGYNTSPNSRALWAGLEPQPSRDGASIISSMSNAPIWEQYQSAGYVAARIDPMCQDWSAYYDPLHLSSNFYANSTASALEYPRSLKSGPRIAHESLGWSCLPPYLPFGEHFAGNFAGATSIKPRCISGTHVGWHTLDWADSFLETYGSQSGDKRAFHLHASFMESHEGSERSLLV